MSSSTPVPWAGSRARMPSSATMQPMPPPTSRVAATVRHACGASSTALPTTSQSTCPMQQASRRMPSPCPSGSSPTRKYRCRTCATPCATTMRAHLSPSTRTATSEAASSRCLTASRRSPTSTMARSILTSAPSPPSRRPGRSSRRCAPGCPARLEDASGLATTTATWWPTPRCTPA